MSNSYSSSLPGPTSDDIPEADPASEDDRLFEDDDGGAMEDVDQQFSTLENFSGAAFDILAIISLLADSDNNPGEFELHTFAYLACLLSVYDGEPASAWGYTFSAVPPTLPFSTLISKAVYQLARASLIVPIAKSDNDGINSPLSQERFTLTDLGSSELEFLSGMTIMRARQKYIDAAASTSLVYSVPAVTNSLVYEPQLWQASRTKTPQTLLVTITSRPLYDQFEALRDAVGDQSHHLSVPAAVYVGYLDGQASDAADGYEGPAPREINS